MRCAPRARGAVVAFALNAPREQGAAGFVCVWCFLCCVLCCVLYSLLMPNTDTAADVHAAAYRSHLVSLGHVLTVDAAGCNNLAPSPARIEYTAHGVGHIPYADENAADEVADAAAAAWTAAREEKIANAPRFCPYCYRLSPAVGHACTAGTGF